MPGKLERPIDRRYLRKELGENCELHLLGLRIGLKVEHTVIRQFGEGVGEEEVGLRLLLEEMTMRMK